MNSQMNTLWKDKKYGGFLGVSWGCKLRNDNKFCEMWILKRSQCDKKILKKKRKPYQLTCWYKQRNSSIEKATFKLNIYFFSFNLQKDENQKAEKSGSNFEFFQKQLWTSAPLPSFNWWNLHPSLLTGEWIMYLFSIYAYVDGSFER